MRISSSLGSFLAEHGFERLKTNFDEEELSLSQLTEMAGGGEKRWHESMAELNVDYSTARELRARLLAGHSSHDEAPPLALEMHATEDVQKAQATLAAMAKAQQQQRPPPAAAGSVFSSGLLAAALGNVATATAPRLAGGGGGGGGVGGGGGAASSSESSDASSRRFPDGQFRHFSESKLSYDSWKAGAPEPDQSAGNSALRAYQQRAASTKATHTVHYPHRAPSRRCTAESVHRVCGAGERCGAQLRDGWDAGRREGRDRRERSERQEGQ